MNEQVDNALGGHGMPDNKEGVAEWSKAASYVEGSSLNAGSIPATLQPFATVTSTLVTVAVSEPLYTRDELVEIMCRANTDHAVCGSDELVYLSMQDASSEHKSPNWHRYRYEMGMAVDALLATGQLKVRGGK